MAGSLRDQLVKAGLATNAQAKKAERQQRAEEQTRRQGTKGGKGRGDAKQKPDGAAAKAKERAKQAQAAKTAKDRALASERNKQAAAKALRAEIKQMILQNDERTKTTKADMDGLVAYSFVHGKKIKRIYVPEEQREKLISGALVVVNNDGLYHFVNKQVAAKIAERDPRRIIVANENKPADETEEDEYYAKFKVPDDLDW